MTSFKVNLSVSSYSLVGVQGPLGFKGGEEGVEEGREHEENLEECKEKKEESSNKLCWQQVQWHSASSKMGIWSMCWLWCWPS